MTKYLTIYSKHDEIILKIYRLFTNWSPFKIYNMGQLRGNYLEMLSYSHIQEKYVEKPYKEATYLLIITEVTPGT